jgi:hypothetical protein
MCFTTCGPVRAPKAHMQKDFVQLRNNDSSLIAPHSRRSHTEGKAAFYGSAADLPRNRSQYHSRNRSPLS